jgi:hypothetical protein
LFHLLQFLSFIKSLELNPGKDCKNHRIKRQDYYCLKFPLSKFVNFTGIKISNHSEREKLILYFYQLQKLNPILYLQVVDLVDFDSILAEHSVESNEF